MWHCQSGTVSVVCVPSLSVVQPLDCWSDPMALVALTLWGSGASRRRQSLPDDLHGSQSCLGDSRTAPPEAARFGNFEVQQPRLPISRNAAAATPPVLAGTHLQCGCGRGRRPSRRASHGALQA